MNRSPLYYPMNRGSDLDAGGAADLQTDIMRFMAILALCLVAIFALVQSLPLNVAAPSITEAEPQVTEIIEQPPVAKPLAATPVREPALPSAPTLPVERPAAEPAPARPQPAPITTAPPVATAAPVASSPEPAQPARPEPAKEPAAATATPEKIGFTLRFESDAALTRLVARNEIGLYAVAEKGALRMSVNRGSYSFWPASAPNQFHEMDAGTVPTEVIAALRRSGSLGLDPAVRWGVTLPAALRQQLNGYLAEHSGGALVIEADGGMRLEP